MGRRRPPQGTQSIVNPEATESKLQHAANNLLDDLSCYLAVEDDPLWQQLLEVGKDKQAELFTQLNAKYGRPVVGRAFRHWRYTVRAR